MVKKICLLFCCSLFLFLKIYGQKKDDQFFEKTIDKIDSLSSKNINATYDLINELDSILAEHPNDKYQWVSYMQRATALHWEDKLELSENYFLKAIKIVEELRDTSGLVKVYSNYANVLKDFDRGDEALEIYYKAFDLAKENEKYERTKAYILYYIGNYFYNENDSISISNYIQSFELAEELGIDELKGGVQYRLALIYKRQKKYDKAIEALALAEKGHGINSVYNLAVYSTWAKVLAGQGKVSEAVEKFKLVVENPKASKRNLIYTYNSLGLLLKDNDRWDESKYYLNEGIKLAKDDERYTQKYAQLLGNFAGIYYDQKDYKRALSLYKKAKEIFFDDPRTSLDNKYFVLAAYLETALKVNGYRELDDAFYTYQLYTDSLLVMEQNAIDEEMIERYRAEVKEAENKELLAAQKLKEEQIISQQRILIGSGIALILISCLSFLFYRQREKQKQLNTKLTSQRDKIKLLNRELNHRVKNNLAFMTSLLEMQGRRTDNTETKQILKESESRLNALSTVHNYLFQNEANTTINLKSYLLEIVSHLQSIFEIPGKDLSFDTYLQDVEFDAEDAMRVGLVVNELVTNSVKHAFADVDDPMIILETKQGTDGKIVLRYKDNGPGYLEKDLMTTDHASQSIGIKLIQLLERQLALKLDLRLG